MAPSNISPGSAATVLSFLALAGLQLETRFRVGEVTKTDVLRAEVSVERADRALVVEGNRLKLARTVLARSIGLSKVVGVMQPAA